MKGKIDATSGTLGNLTITDKLTGGKIEGAEITSTGIVDGNEYTTKIAQGYITTSYIKADAIWSGINTIYKDGINIGDGVTLRDMLINCGGTIIGVTGRFTYCEVGGVSIATSFSNITSEFNLVWEQISMLWNAVHALQA
jgi:hypothetical protein